MEKNGEKPHRDLALLRGAEWGI